MEEHLTSLLCEMLDEQMSQHHRLAYSAADLQRDLALDSHGMRFGSTMRTMKYPQGVEANLTFADLGVIVSYRDTIDPESSFDRGILLQAKKLYRRQDSGAYSVEDAFKQLKGEQLKKIARLNDQHRRSTYNGSRWRYCSNELCFYAFYCPRGSTWDQRSMEQVAYYTNPDRRVRCWHHPDGNFLEAMNLYQYAQDIGRHVPGLLVSEIHWLTERYLDGKDGSYEVRDRAPLTTARDAYEKMWNCVFPLSHFIVYNMLLGHRGCSDPQALTIVRGQQLESTVLPRQVMTIELQVGTRPQ